MVKKAKTTTKSKKTTAAPPPAPVPEVSAPVEVEAVEKSTEPNLTESFGELLAQLTALRSQLTTVTHNVRLLQKRADKEIKQATKNSKKRKNKNSNRQPSGFVKPTKISPELATFLGKPKGTEMARTQVTREINGYILTNKLQDPDNRRNILADKKLSTLLRLKKGDELTYFNLQKYMSPHFAKKGEENSFVSS